MKTCRIYRTPRWMEQFFPSITFGGQVRDPEKRIWLTFDDGPDPDSTPALIATLTTLDLPAVFFLRGDKVLEHKSLLKLYGNVRFQIGYHGLTHLPWWWLSPAMLRKEMNPSYCMDTQAFSAPLLLRPPYGRFDFQVLHSCYTLGARMVLWRSVFYDWDAGLDASSLAERILKYIRPGDILVLHDGGINGSILPETLKKVVPLLRNYGYHFSNINTLLNGYAS